MLKSASALMVGATLLFAAMGVCVKVASQHYGAGEIVFYRGVVGALVMAAMARWRGGRLATAVPLAHAWRSLTGVLALFLWFYAIAHLPLATAMTLNYTSPVWMAMFLIGGSVLVGKTLVDPRLLGTVLVGFVGVALVLRPTVDANQLWHGLAGLVSGMLSALSYLQVTALGRLGEPGYRTVFYFSVGGIAAGGLGMLLTGISPHTAFGLLTLLAVGVFATLAQILMTRAYAIGRTLVNASLQYLGIVFSFVFGVLLFDEPVTALAMVGMLLTISAGVAATLLRGRSAQDAPASTLDS